MAKVPRGTWSALNYEAIAEVQRMMLKAQESIRAEWAVQDTGPKLERMGYEEFFKRLSDADKDPDAYAQFQQDLASQLMPLIQQALAMPAQGQGQAG